MARKPSFRHAWRKAQFCVISMDAFYEPNYETGKAVRWCIQRVDVKPFFERFPAEQLTTFAEPRPPARKG